MTPEERANPIITRIVSAFTGGDLLTIGELRSTLSQAFSDVRSEALEEAAKIAETAKHFEIPGRGVSSWHTGDEIAAAIRERMKT